MHRILLRQLRRALSLTSDQEALDFLQAAVVSADAQDPSNRLLRILPQLFTRIGETYEQNDRDLELGRRSLEISSQELMQANNRLREESRSQGLAIASLKETANAILAETGRRGLDDNTAGLEELSTLMSELVNERARFQHELEIQKFALDSHAMVSIATRDGTITYANGNFCNACGYAHEDILGGTYRLVSSGTHDRDFYKSMWDSLLMGSVWQGEICNRRRDGQLYWVATTLIPVPSATGAIERFVAIGTDISARKSAESALLVALQKAEDANRAKSEFLATMSHEIRTPMNGVLGMTDLLIDALAVPEQRQIALTVKSSAESLLEILNDILDLSKLEAGRMEMESAIFRPADLASGVADLFSPRAREAGLTLELFVDSSLDSNFRSDPGRLRQVLLNLVGNAVKFTSRGFVRIRMLAQGEGEALGLRVEVQDSGSGISESAKPRIFGVFNQADASTARRYGGSGLGLAICKRIVELLHGSIGFDSVEGQGTTFWFEVPLAPVVAVTEPASVFGPESNHSLPGSPLHILVAEDNPVNQKVAMGILARIGHTAELARNGAEAVAKVLSGRFDLVLMDMQMPEVDGLEGTRRIRALEGDLARIPIVAMTANAMKGDRKICLDAGMDDYLTKPITRSELVAVLDRWSRRLGKS
jgi:two-component system sensor histidine kinase/response regulator